MLCLAAPENAGIHDGESWVREWVMSGNMIWIGWGRRVSTSLVEEFIYLEAI